MVEQETENTAGEAKSAEEASLDSMAEAMRMAFLAGIGVLDLAREKTEDVMAHLAERGEKVHEERRAYWKHKMSHHSARTGRMQARMDRHMDKFMSRLNVPTKTDIDALNAKLEELSQKIDALSKTPPTA
jgi:poly(hydroxyalkanoate) granule-associated protein